MSPDGSDSRSSSTSSNTVVMILALALGTGGLPRGRVVEMYGPESSGKTTVALHVVAEAQKMGGESWTMYTPTGLP